MADRSILSLMRSHSGSSTPPMTPALMNPRQGQPPPHKCLAQQELQSLLPRTSIRPNALATDPSNSGLSMSPARNLSSPMNLWHGETYPSDETAQYQFSPPHH